MFSIEVPFFDLDQIYNSGQHLRWIKVRDKKYVMIHKDKAVKIEQQKERLIFNCTDEEFYNIWYWYLDLSIDYMELNYQTRRIDQYFKICAVRSQGVRLINQDLFEVIITSILKDTLHESEIKSAVELLCTIYGIKHKNAMREIGQVTWFEFPTIESILKNPDKLNLCFVGQAKEKIISLCEDITEGWLTLQLLDTMENKDAISYLIDFDGINTAVAESICLHGLHRKDVLVIDTYMDKMIKQEVDVDNETFLDWYLGEVKGYEGIIGHYMLYNIMNIPKEVR